MTNTGQLTQDTLNDDKYEELWKVRLSGSSDSYELSKNQARLLMEEIARGNRGIVPFSSFVIPINFIIEFYRVKRFLKNTHALPERATEEPYKPISSEKFAELKKKIYKNIGKPMSK